MRSAASSLAANPVSQHWAKSRFWQRFFEPLDIASLVYFRIGFGWLMAWDLWRYLKNDWLGPDYLESAFHFKYFGFYWVQVWPGDGLYIHFVVVVLLALMILLGCFYRVAAPLFFLSFTYFYLMEKAEYLNHFYFICLVSFLMIFIPCHRAFSIDVLRRPALRSNTAPAWCLGILCFQMGVVYFFGGLAKINYDWLHGEPIRMWLAERADYPVIGKFLLQEWAVAFFAYGGLLLDLLIVPALLWRKTRWWALACLLFFHLMNYWLYNIGVFPWFSMAMSLLFFPPDWPRKAIDRLLALLKLQRCEAEQPVSVAPYTPPSVGWQRVIVSLLGVYVALQVLFPLRHWLYPGNVSWTEEGHDFSWHMKLRNKEAEAQFIVTNPITKATWKVAPEKLLTERQARKMPSRPDMVVQFAHYLEKLWRETGEEVVEVRAHVLASLNGRKRQFLIDPNVDLTKVKDSFQPKTWVVPLREPLLHPSRDHDVSPPTPDE